MSSIESRLSPSESEGPRSRQTLPSQVSGASRCPKARLSAEWLVEQKDLPALVAMLSAAQLHGVLIEQDLDDCAEILEWVRGEALVRIFDLDLWTAPTGDPQLSAGLEISASRFLDWVSAWRNIEPGFAAKRFFELDEQTLVLIARAIFEIVPVGLENGVFISDDFFLAPDNKFYLRMKVTGSRDEELALIFLRELFDDRFEIASRVLAYASMLVLAECEEEALRLREGRLADDGFVGHQEALDLLRARGFDRWTEKTTAAFSDGEKRVQQAVRRLREQGGFQSELMPDLVDGFADSLRQLDEPRRAQVYEAILPPARVLALLEGEANSVALEALEPSAQSIVELASDENLVWDVAAEALRSARRKLMTLEQGLDEALSDGDEDDSELLVDRVLEALAAEDIHDWAELQGRLARQANAVASLSREFVSPSTRQTAIRQLRAALNIGLEWLSLGRPSPKSYAVSQDPLPSETLSPEQIEQGLNVLRQFGVEAVFRAGLDVFWELSRSFAKRMESFKPAAVKGLTQLVETQRYDAAQEIVWKSELDLDAPLRLLAESLLRRFPLSPPDLLVSQEKFERLSSSTRLLATLDEWHTLWVLSQKLTAGDANPYQTVKQGGSHAQADVH